MPNWCFTEVRVCGNKKEIQKLYSIMRCLEDMEKPLIDNDFGKNWYGNLVHQLGGDYHEIYCRGHWMDLRVKESIVEWADMTAWSPVLDVFQLLEKTIPGLKVYFSAEEGGCDIFLTNDIGRRFFSARYILSTEQDREYYDDITSLLQDVSTYLHREIKTIEQLWDIINEREDWSLNEFDII